LRPELRKNKEMEHSRDSEKNGNAPGGKDKTGCECGNRKANAQNDGEKIISLPISWAVSAFSPIVPSVFDTARASCYGTCDQGHRYFH
jgi:hypothetical protein